MRHTKQIDMPLLSWAVWKMTQVLAALKPGRTASEVSLIVARSGNPAGG